MELCHPRAIREEFVQPRDLQILYLRKSDAEISWDERRAAAAARTPGSVGDGVWVPERS